MDLTLVNDAARAVHLLGLALGFGLAILADVSASRAVIRPLSESDILLLKRLHHFVSLGLVLLWISGLVLFWLRTGFDPDRVSPKLMTKVAVVSILTLNAMAIGRVGIPTLLRFQSWRFGDIPFPERAQLCALGTLSAACWIAALSLGVFGYFRTLGAEELTHWLALTYLVALSLAIVAATITPVIAFLARLRERRAAT